MPAENPDSPFDHGFSTELQVEQYLSDIESLGSAEAVYRAAFVASDPFLDIPTRLDRLGLIFETTVLYKMDEAAQASKLNLLILDVETPVAIAVPPKPEVAAPKRASMFYQLGKIASGTREGLKKYTPTNIAMAAAGVFLIFSRKRK